MNSQYVTGAIIKRLREKKGLTQIELADSLGVSDKAVSKWETGRSYPDIALLENLAKALGVSIIELLSGSEIVNGNLSANVLRSKIYVCPICGNVIVALGDTVVSCHGINLCSTEAESVNDKHFINVSVVEDEYYVSLDHPMTKEHYISFIIAFSDDGYSIVKLYPESFPEARFKINRVKYVYAYCNKHGLFKLKIDKKAFSV